MLIRDRFFIGGAWVASESGKTTPNLNPADTRDVLGHVPLSTAEETKRAVDAAQLLPPNAYSQGLLQLAAQLLQRRH